MKQTFLIVLLILAATFTAGATTIDPTLVKEVTYDYQMDYDKAVADCIGTLDVSISIPGDMDVHSLMFMYTARHTVNDDRIFFAIKSSYPADTDHISIDNISWGTYFRLAAILTDGSWIYSPTFCTDDFISEEDMELIRGHSSTETISIDPAPLKIKDRHLSIADPGVSYIEVFDIFGRQVYSGTADREISLENVHSPFIIVRYMLSDNLYTSKIIMK